jgi:hypothetical protein
MTEQTYAAHIVDGLVVQVIVGTAQWAVEHLGGEWVQPPELVGIGWTYDGTNIVPPPAPEPDAQGDDVDPLQYNVI